MEGFVNRCDGYLVVADKPWNSRCFSRYSRAGREAFAGMDREMYLPTHRKTIFSNLSNLSVTIPSLFTKVLPSFIPQALKQLVNSCLASWVHSSIPCAFFKICLIPHELPQPPSHSISTPSTSSLSLPLPSNFIFPLLKTSSYHLRNVCWLYKFCRFSETEELG